MRTKLAQFGFKALCSVYSNKSKSMCRGKEDLQEKEADKSKDFILLVYLHHDVISTNLIVMLVEGVLQKKSGLKVHLETMPESRSFRLC